MACLGEPSTCPSMRLSSGKTERDLERRAIPSSARVPRWPCRDCPRRPRRMRPRRREFASQSACNSPGTSSRLQASVDGQAAKALEEAVDFGAWGRRSSANADIPASEGHGDEEQATPHRNALRAGRPSPQGQTARAAENHKFIESKQGSAPYKGPVDGPSRRRAGHDKQLTETCMEIGRVDMNREIGQHDAGQPSATTAPPLEPQTSQRPARGRAAQGGAIGVQDGQQQGEGHEYLAWVLSARVNQPKSLCSCDGQPSVATVKSRSVTAMPAEVRRQNQCADGNGTQQVVASHGRRQLQVSPFVHRVPSEGCPTHQTPTPSVHAWPMLTSHRSSRSRSTGPQRLP
ncbi:hypothetical protein FQR65_LT20610 [Abscondita terminalis]|nr:hypothetical protein FQR65_LT20610 [Abscondita terminalis]